jgi:hypothetical protein
VQKSQPATAEKAIAAKNNCKATLKKAKNAKEN